MSRIPRRASRNLTPWQRLKRWLRMFWHCDTVIQFDEAPAKGVRITFDYTSSYEERK